MDDVIFTTVVYRKMLDCMARPGKVATLQPHPMGVGLGMSPYCYSMAAVLLDQEVTFCLTPADSTTEKYVSGSLGTRPAALERCDFLFADGPHCPDLTLLKRGTLEFCDEGASVIIRVASLSVLGYQRPGGVEGARSSASFPDARDTVVASLSGPGVDGSTWLAISGMPEQVLEQREVCNAEFPKGIDLFLIDAAGRLACLPRSTKIDRGLAV